MGYDSLDLIYASGLSKSQVPVEVFKFFLVTFEKAKNTQKLSPRRYHLTVLAMATQNRTSLFGHCPMVQLRKPPLCPLVSHLNNSIFETI